jgi:hypothetical protein
MLCLGLRGALFCALFFAALVPAVVGQHWTVVRAGEKIFDGWVGHCVRGALMNGWVSNCSTTVGAAFMVEQFYVGFACGAWYFNTLVVVNGGTVPSPAGDFQATCTEDPGPEPDPGFLSGQVGPLSGLAIAGIAVGGVVALALVGVACVKYRKRGAPTAAAPEAAARLCTNSAEPEPVSRPPPTERVTRPPLTERVTRLEAGLIAPSGAPPSRIPADSHLRVTAVAHLAACGRTGALVSGGYGAVGVVASPPLLSPDNWRRAAVQPIVQPLPVPHSFPGTLRVQQRVQRAPHNVRDILQPSAPAAPSASPLPSPLSPRQGAPAPVDAQPEVVVVVPAAGRACPGCGLAHADARGSPPCGRASQ